jgi:hypothetical protein
MTNIFSYSALRAALAIGILALSASAPAQAVVYGFTFMSGAQNLNTLKQAGNYIFVDVTENLATPANDVLFKLTSQIPEPASLLVKYWFDTGAHTDLFTDMSVYDQSPGGGMIRVTPTPYNNTHPYLPTLTPEYMFGLSTVFPYDREVYAVSPGEYLTASATLGAGKTFADVIGAMNEGITPATRTTGLRIGVIALHLLGVRPDPTVTLMDDAGFVTASIAPVPEAETWALMLAGLGLVGFMVHRRKS